MTGMWPLSSQAGWLHAQSQEQSGPLKGSAEAPAAGCGAGADGEGPPFQARDIKDQSVTQD